MSKDIYFDEVDMLFLKIETDARFPMSLVVEDRPLKPLEEIIQDEE